MKCEISIPRQELRIIDAGQPDEVILVSTSRFGPGERKNSNCTPRGKHIVRAKLGGGLPSGAVLQGRRFTEEIYSAELARQYPQRDWVLSRILWLSGCEPGLNRLGGVDSMQRYIYIHGTPDSEPMGVPRSHGCIRLRNDAVIALYARLSVGTTIEILS